MAGIRRLNFLIKNCKTSKNTLDTKPLSDKLENTGENKALRNIPLHSRKSSTKSNFFCPASLNKYNLSWQ